MKKISTSISPFLMLIIPVIIFLGLSLALKQENNQDELASGAKNKTAILVEAGTASLIQVLLKK